MSVRIGIAVGADAVRAVAVRRGAVIWCAEGAPGEGDALEATLLDLLGTVPGTRWRRPRAGMVLGPARSQTKRLAGLPPLRDRRELAGLVREGASRFFLRNGGSLVTTGVRVDDDGAVWAAALEQPVVEAVRAACRAKRLRLVGVAPAVVVLARGLEEDSLVWRDADVVVEARYENRRLAAVRYVGSPGAAPPAPRPCPGLISLGEGAWRFADAYGAAFLGSDDALLARPARARHGTSIPRWRVALAAAVVGLALLAYLAAPGVAAAVAARRMSTTLAELAEARRVTVAAERELERFTVALNEVATFAAGQRSRVRLLKDLAEALPGDAAIAALRVNDTSGTIALLSGEAAHALRALEAMEGLVSTELVGPVTREAAGERTVERVVVQFRLRDDSPPAQASRGAP